MASVKLSTKAVGSIVKLKVDGTLRDFIVVHQGKPSSLYDASCDGTWLLLKDCLEQKRWHSANTNDYKNSEIHSYLNNTWLNKLDANIRAQVKQVKLPYVNGTANSAVASGANGLSCKIFLLSGYEVGFTQSVNSYFPIDGVRLAYFQDGDGTAARNIRIANYNGSATDWWLRSPVTNYTDDAWFVYTNGSYDDSNCTNTMASAPLWYFPLPSWSPMTVASARTRPRPRREASPSPAPSRAEAPSRSNGRPAPTPKTTLTATRWSGPQTAAAPGAKSTRAAA